MYIFISICQFIIKNQFFLILCDPIYVSFPSEIHLSISDTDPERAEWCFHGYQKLGGNLPSMLPVLPKAPVA